MTRPADHARLARDGAEAILGAFEEYGRRFRAITRRARSRFEGRDWHGMQRDAVERLDLYGAIITRIVAEIRDRLGAAVAERGGWAAMKAAYSGQITARADRELAETFFNSVTRRIFATVGVDPKIEFVSSERDAAPPPSGRPVYRTFTRDRLLAEVLKEVLASYAFSVPFEDLDRDAHLAARAIERERQAAGSERPIDAVDMIDRPFYRNQGAYLVGRVRAGDRAMPLALALHNEPRGLLVDAALLTADEVAILFSFTRSYFHVEVDRPHDLIAFLRTILPPRRVGELYTALGFNKHGKTELYRDLMRHIARSDDRFEIAPGERGMVMIVFTLPSFDVVFKVIRDTFAYPKTSTRRDVVAKYDLVFKHDRAGRLADAQEFEHLAFDRDRFTDDLLAALAAGASESVTIGPRTVDIKHLYVERRMVPLNLYLREVDESAARAAVIDYGRAIKDLAATSIFPGDLLLKNFGVTRLGRVIFYDYDELCLLTDCQFRDLPQAQDPSEDSGAEPWFYVGPNDVFPEEFLTFLGLTGPLRQAFLAAHHDLLTPAYWRAVQARHRAGELIDIIPYRPERRLRTFDIVPYRLSRRLDPQ